MNLQSLGFITKKDNIIQIEEIRKLSETEYQKFLESLKDLYKIDDEIALFHMIYINYIDFYEYMKYITSNFHEIQYTETKIKNYINNLNCKLNNFLSAFRLYVDHFDRKITDEYGKDSEEYKLFQNEISRLFDNYFPYRFFYHLRNYIQHRNVAISILEIYEDSEKIELKIALNRDELLSDYKWHSLVKKDLIKQDEDIEIFSLMSELIKNLKDLTKILIRDELKKLNESVEFIESLIYEIDENNSPLIFDYSRDNIVYSDFPIDLLNFIEYIIK